MMNLNHSQKGSRHPRKNFKVRQYIASKGIARLTFHFILLNVTLAILVGAVIAGLSDKLPRPATVRATYIELMGRDALSAPSEEFSIQNLAKPLLATASLILPALFLGIILYKFFVLKRENIIFRDRCDLQGASINLAQEIRRLRQVRHLRVISLLDCPVIRGSLHRGHDNSINVYFYISSSLELSNLQFSAFIRTYEKQRETNPGGFYPMNTFPLRLNQDAVFPIPFNYTPSRFRIPLFKDVARIPADDHAQIEIGDGNRMTIHTPDRDIEIVREKGDFCEIHIISQGDVPDIHSRFVENHRYRIPDDIAFNPLPEMKTSYNTEKNAFDVENWEDF